jgi:hypothetical protein
MGAQARLLQGDVLGPVVVVEAGFADGDDQRIGRQTGQPGDIRLVVTDLIGVHANRGGHLRIARGQRAHDRRVAKAHAHAQEVPDANCGRLRQQGLDPLQRGIDQVQVAMGIDQHAHIVCVWRSLVSAPAR